MVQSESQANAELTLQVVRRMQAAANASNLKEAQWSALRYLSKANPSARTNRAFAAYHQTTTGTVAVTFKALVDKGLVEKKRDPSDGRLTRFNLTQLGRQTLKDDPINVLAESIEGLSEEQRRALTEIFYQLLL